MNGWLIIGVGNRLRRDDAVGPLIADRFGQRGVDTLEMNGDGLALIDGWAGYAGVIIIDAARSGAVPGTIHCINALQQPIPRNCFYSSSHQLGVAEGVELARLQGRLPEDCWLLGVEGEAFGFGEGLSTAVSRALPAAVAQVEEILAKWGGLA